MKHKAIAALLTVTLLAGTMLLPGCGKKAESESSVPASEEASVIEAESVDPDAESIDPADSQPEEDPESETADLPYGEAENTYAGEIIETNEDAQELALGTFYPVPGDASEEEASYLLRIDSMEMTDERNEYEDNTMTSVVKVVYTVTNNTVDESLLVGSMSFRLMDENNATFGEYFLNPEENEQADILPVEKGQSGTFAIAYAIEGHPTAVTLVFDDFFLTSGTQYVFHGSQELIEDLAVQ